MPFLGLIDEQGKEIKGRGYHRIDLSQFSFKISPPDNMVDQLIFLNQTTIYWPLAKGKWPEVVGCCVFAEIDDKKPFVTRRFGTKKVLFGETVAMAPGQLKFGQTITPNERRNFKTLRCPKCGEKIV